MTPEQEHHRYLTGNDGGLAALLERYGDPVIRYIIREGGLKAYLERDRLLHQCLSQLHGDYREALYLTYFEGQSYLNAARVMGKSVKQITNFLYRGKNAMDDDAS